ncbi:MAG TPA: L,D-transpeptidase family protein [Allosphingosinicella sp.]|nr:L,D-transpeptidase family protein [Allosphingosinicella sp.]
MSPKIWIAAALIALSACAEAPPAPVGPVPPAVEAAALRGAATDPRVARFYAARQWRPAWTAEAETALRAEIGEADKHGLRPDDFLAGLARACTPAAREAGLSLAALSYAEALARGRVDPSRTEGVYEIPRPNPDLAAGLNEALDGDLRGWIDGLAPQDADYRALSSAYLEARRQVAAARGRPASEPSAQSRGRRASELGDRVRTLAVNLERRRWLERAPARTRIDVNTASTMLVYWRDGTPRDTRRVVVGSAGERATPSLATPMFQLVANPTWTVPKSIGMSARYMARNGIAVRNGRRVQPSGPRNALGLVKFDLRNGHAIYLHDTPSKALFLRDERHASHGCVRVHDALEFAEIIARDEGVLDQWRRAQRPPRPDGEGRLRYRQLWIPLQREIPVRLLYHTAFVENGAVRIVRDVYGRDARVAAALGIGPPVPRPVAAPRPADVGP